jgi:hypothetical protein
MFQAYLNNLRFNSELLKVPTGLPNNELHSAGRITPSSLLTAMPPAQRCTLSGILNGTLNGTSRG